MRTAIATIETEIGTMTIYFNGIGEEITGEKDDVIETLEYAPTSFIDAVNAVYDMYSSWPGWDLNMLVEED